MTLTFDKNLGNIILRVHDCITNINFSANSDILNILYQSSDLFDESRIILNRAFHARSHELKNVFVKINISNIYNINIQ